MTTLPDLHDGFFDGLWLSADKRARFFVRTVAGERSTIIMTDVQALNICGLRAGNIIFDLVLIAPDKLSMKDIEQAYDLKSGEVEKASQLLRKAQEQGLSGLEINPSYGAEGIAIFRAVATVPEHVLA
ncbi:MAG TPA: hypothetical protein VFK81_08605 [Terriglobales bacterium]|jgi:hypothetical protein|nr:hypothetical protein [Terriglobales bacterium]HKT11709.1 hypothetical protein [Terriglobia bacterium]